MNNLEKSQESINLDDILFNQLEKEELKNIFLILKWYLDNKKLSIFEVITKWNNDSSLLKRFINSADSIELRDNDDFVELIDNLVLELGNFINSHNLDDLYSKRVEEQKQSVLSKVEEALIIDSEFTLADSSKI